MTHQPDPFFALRTAIAAGAIILANEGRHGRPLNYHVVNAEGRDPKFTCDPHEYLAVVPYSANAAAPAIPFDDDVRNILGRPCFTLIGLANMLRKAGHKIPPKAEEEQAACLHWMLSLYLKHGANWAKEGEAELKAVNVDG